MNSEIGSLVVSVAALVVSALSGFGAYRVQRTQTELQNRLLALEATRERAKTREGRKARLVARLGSDQHLSVSNEGAALAQRIQIRMDGRPLSEHALWVHGQDEVTEIGSGARIDYILGFAMDKPTKFILELIWTDESGDPGEWKSQLKL